MNNYCIEDTVMNHYAYTPIPTDPVFLSLNGCRDWGTLHQRIRKAFGFPDYYGENWDAMWDCLTDVFLRPVQRHIVVEGFELFVNKRIEKPVRRMDNRLF